MPERAGGGWYPPDDGPSAPDLYAAWLHEHGYEDSPERRAEFAGETGVTLPEECEPHTPAPDGYLQWHAWAEEMEASHVQRQCKGCGLWAVWERRAEFAGDELETLEED